MLLGEVLTDHPNVEGRRAPLPNLRGIGQHLALFFQFVNRWRPDVSAIDIPALPGGDNRRRLQVNNLYLAGLNAPVFQRCQQAVMRGGDKRHCDAFADQIFGFRDAFLHHQRFGISELRRQQENFNRHLLAGGHRQRAGADVTDLHIAGGKGAYHAGAAVKFPPVDGRPAGFGEGVVRLGDFRRLSGGLIRHGHVDRLRLEGGDSQRRQKSNSRCECHNVCFP